MKKATMTALVSYLNDMIAMNGGKTDTEEFIVNARDELTAELNKGADEKARKAEMYESVKPIVFRALSETPVTISELHAEIAKDLPEGFTKSKLQYAITRLWKDEVTKVEGRVNSYAIKA